MRYIGSPKNILSRPIVIRDEMRCEQFSRDGYSIVENILSAEDLGKLVTSLEELPRIKAGTRNLLSHSWCKELVDKVKNHATIHPLLPRDAAAVQCTYFRKTEDANWLVAPHQDKVIPVSQRIASPQWNGWSVKEGILYAQPPREILEQLVAVRIHLEPNTERNGPLRIIPGSHISASSPRPEVECTVGEGGAVVMRPLVVHASSKLLQGSRRVLHFLFGPRNLPNGAEWVNAI